MDGAEFHVLVYHVVRQIPQGKVTSYGHIAKLIGMPRHSRHVGQGASLVTCVRLFHGPCKKALKFLAPEAGVPWQRVISSSGQISSRGPQTDGAERQRIELENEGVTVRNMRVSWADYGWFPESVDLNV